MIDDAVTSSTSIVDSITPLADVGDAVETVGGMAKIIQEYGPFIVILAVFLLLFLGIIAFVLKSNSSMNKQMLESQKAAIDTNQQMTQQMMTAILTIVNNKGDFTTTKSNDEEDEEETQKPKKKKQIVSSYIDSSLAFKDAARIAISKVHCERIAIYLFHNGNHTPYGYPFAKMSCVHEWTARGSGTVRGSTHVNIPLYAFEIIVEGLVKDGEFAVSNIYDHGILSADEQVFQFISGSSTRALFALGIKDRDGDLAAFTIAEFKEPQDFSMADSYNSVKSALKDMNDNIYSIVINQDFRDSYSKTEDSK